MSQVSLDLVLAGLVVHAPLAFAAQNMDTVVVALNTALLLLQRLRLLQPQLLPQPPLRVPLIAAPLGGLAVQDCVVLNGAGVAPGHCTVTLELTAYGDWRSMNESFGFLHQKVLSVLTS